MYHDCVIFVFLVVLIITEFFDIFLMNSYHLRCLGPAVVGINGAEGYKCPYCQFVVNGSVSKNADGPLVCNIVFLLFKFENSFVYLSLFFFYGCRDFEGSVLHWKCLLN